MVKAVLQAIPTYSISVFKMPKKLCSDLEALISRFWWKNNRTDAGIHWKTWELLGSSKDGGGLGFRSMEGFNRAMLAKQGWRLVQRQDSLVAKIFNEKYLKWQFYTAAKLGRSPSLIWRSLWEVKDVVERGLRWRVGNGRKIQIWDQKWLPSPISYCVQSPVQVLVVDARVVDLIDEERKEWKVDLISRVFKKEEADMICAIPISSFGADDRMFWGFSKSGKFTVRSAYHADVQWKIERKGGSSGGNRDAE
ncbi:hypothetical protein F2P56_013044 [Juglans regia]|uniref:Uncharacterized mitochondrial protein AtMg00310-like n=2 Tax=Juglans regia TaxID=51240 RepID=A0A2I4FCJ3_JUGRE|nr:uncharacterized mitochondrial protein AtMg00310-like [Juglans regia]KAF5468936.1 hypothetical protein F2P56_013044 [Juglans regia]